MDEHQVKICQDRDSQNATAMSDSETSEGRRCSRHWHILPFVTNISFLFSSTWLINIVSQNVVEDVTFLLPSWMLFATIAVTAPSSLAIARLLPDPAIAVAIAGLLTSTGLFWTYFETGPLQMVSLCVLTGVGVSFSVQSVGIALSPYFIRESGAGSFVTLLLSALNMLVPMAWKAHTATVGRSIFLYLSPVALITSQLPLLAYLLSGERSRRNNQQAQKLYEQSQCGNSLTLSEKDEKVGLEDSNSSCDNNDRQDVHKVVPYNGWALSIMSVVVWIAWGAGIDTTWLSLGWRYHYFQTPSGLPALQMLLSLVLLGIKVCTELSQPHTSFYHVNLASNYMQLGLLGTAGLLLCLFPEQAQPFHNHLLFTAGCALQLDDLSDLCLVRDSSHPSSVFKYRLISYQLDYNEETDRTASSSHTLCCMICHIVSILLMSFLSIILGVQIANILGALSTLPPLSFICSCNGLMVMSVASICVALMGPKLWKGHERFTLIV